MEDLSETRNELMDGVVVAMSGNSYPHLLIVGNLMLELNGRLPGKPFFEGAKQITLLNPTLLIEVLSPSTEAYDRGQKFLHYQQIPTLREYALVSQEEARVELYTRGENSAWTYKMVSGPEAAVSFASIDCSVPLADIYRDLELGEPNDRTHSGL